ncbi:MAG TPA: sugar ABC transporter substrate-binding protein [Candidatus Scybalocola faecavium]|nr:sugar ABC transporter substrate-binding protein [Candidatus Scybalocola faecavium]
MKNIQKLLSVTLAGVMVAGSLAGCSSGGTATQGDTGAADTNSVQTGENIDNSGTVEVKEHKIGIGLYTDSGKSVEALKAFLDGISETVGCEFVYTTLSTYDEATNISSIQNLISSGCEGIILTADMGTQAIVEECQAAGVYMAGYLCDYNTSYTTAYDAVFGNEYFLGTVCDGLDDPSPYGTMVAEDVIEKGYKNIGVITFPSYAYPKQANVDAAFREKIQEYNDSASEADQITVADTIELNFTALEDTYLSENPDLDCIFSIAAGAGNVYPVLVANNKTDIKLYTTGFEGTDDADNFGSNGNQCYQGIMFSTPEAIVYPLCLIIDQLNGITYSDLPEEAEVVSCSPMIILSDEDLAKVEESSIYYTASYDDAFLTGEDVVNLCASYNPDATYANLVDTINHMGVEDLQ